MRRSTIPASGGIVAALLLTAACAPSGPPLPPGDADAPRLLVDADGRFVSETPVAGAWYPGPGVALLLPPDGATDAARLAGRLASAAPPDAPVLWHREADGTFSGRRARLARGDAAQATHIADGLAALAAGGGELAAFGALARDVADGPRPAPSPPRSPTGEPGTPLEHPADAPLLDRVPADCVAVRFRSVEAAYRLVGLCDDFVAQLAARADTGGAPGSAWSAGTVRMTLHDLLLPTIWRTNPGGVKGVSECALVVAPPFRRGRLRAALLLRIRDPELHSMETRAALGLEATPDHLWRPDADPFPTRRERRNLRRVVGDVEVVATDPELFARLLTEPGRGADAVASATAPLPPDPGPQRAFTLLFPTAAAPTSDAAPRGDDPGLRALAARWVGRNVPTDTWPEPSAAAPEFERLARDVIAAAADTDGDGARVAVRLRDAAAATQFAAALRADGPTPEERRDACAAALGGLVPLALVEPRADDVAERAFVWLARRPVCPDGGTYRFDAFTAEPQCTVHGSRGALRTAPAPAPEPSPVAEVAVDGALVTFRFRIDWSSRK